MRELLKGGDGKSRILLTGGGRVAGGALEILEGAGIRQVDPAEFLQGRLKRPFLHSLDPWHYTCRKDGSRL